MMNDLGEISLYSCDVNFYFWSKLLFFFNEEKEKLQENRGANRIRKSPNSTCCQVDPFFLLLRARSFAPRVPKREKKKVVSLFTLNKKNKPMPPRQRRQKFDR